MQYRVQSPSRRQWAIATCKGAVLYKSYVGVQSGWGKGGVPHPFAFSVRERVQYQSRGVTVGIREPNRLRGAPTIHHGINVVPTQPRAKSQGDRFH